MKTQLLIPLLLTLFITFVFSYPLRNIDVHNEKRDNTSTNADDVVIDKRCPPIINCAGEWVTCNYCSSDAQSQKRDLESLVARKDRRSIGCLEFVYDCLGNRIACSGCS